MKFHTIEITVADALAILSHQSGFGHEKNEVIAIITQLFIKSPKKVTPKNFGKLPHPPAGGRFGSP